MLKYKKGLKNSTELKKIDAVTWRQRILPDGRGSPRDRTDKSQVKGSGG